MSCSGGSHGDGERGFDTNRGGMCIQVGSSDGKGIGIRQEMIFRDEEILEILENREAWEERRQSGLCFILEREEKCCG